MIKSNDDKKLIVFLLNVFTYNKIYIKIAIYKY